MTPERVQHLLHHARTALAIHEQMPAELRAGGLPNIMLGADEAIELLTGLNELASCDPAKRTQVERVFYHKGKPFHITLEWSDEPLHQHQPEQVNTPFNAKDAAGLLDYTPPADLAIRSEQPAKRPKSGGRQKGSKNKPPIDNLGYEELSLLHRRETDPRRRAKIKLRMEQVKQQEIETMVAADAPPAREFKPFGAHNRHANY